MSTVFGHGCTDPEHRRTFEGKSTTMHPQACATASLKHRHIEADAAVFDFEKKYLIKEAYLERLPAIDSNGLVKETAESNLIGKAVLNIARAMEANAKLVIEWDPCIIQLNGAPALINPTTLDTRVKHNPFTGFIIDTDFFKKSHIVCEVSKIMQGDHLFGRLSKIFSVSYDTIVNAIKWELDIIDWFNRLKEASRDPHACILNMPFVDMYNFLTQGPLCFPIRDDCTPCFLKKFSGSFNPSVHNKESFLRHSGLAILLRWMTCEANTPLVIKFMEQHGFKDVTVSFRTNPYSGRENVYLVEAYRDINKTLPEEVQSVKD